MSLKHQSYKSSVRQITSLCSLLAACLGLFTTVPAKAASLQLVTNNWGTNGLPTNVVMYSYVPDNVAPNPPVLVLLHYWGGTASSVFGQAQAGGLVAAADQYGFIMVVPQRASDCWDYSSAQSLTHDGGGETHAIAQMVRYAITNYHANADRVYVTGDSCGGMMTEAMLAVYPDIFKAGVAYAGVPIGGQWTPVTHTAQQWGDLARACYPGYTGPRPRVQLWHGTADATVSYSNHLEAIMQWGNVLGLSTSPAVSNITTIVGVTNPWIHQSWKDTNGATLLDAWADIGGDHGPSDALFKARYIVPFLGLDKGGLADPGAGGQRGRPKLNAARTTFVADNGERLRGPYTSTEWTGATDYTNIAKMKTLGFNAVHLYGESFDPNYPNAGSTAPGYATNRIDSIVQSTRDLGLYLVITIGNGAANGNYNRAYITNFWKLYSARYANETHVMFEIQNEPVAWGPPYSSPTATPPGAIDMEVAAYRTIRQYAPDTPVLLFTYAVLGDSGGASAALTDIHAFNTNVFGTPNVTWTNEAVGFHGYAGATAMSNAVSQILAAGYPCFMTEFGGGVWGTGVPGIDAYAIANLEHLGVSWLTFQYIPPTGVSDDVTDPKHYAEIVNWTGLSWAPDFGNWPAVRGPFGNGGYPWTTPDYNGSGILAGSLRIQAENFDSGGEGVAYHESTTNNLGGQYRTSEAVDIETTTDTGGGYDVTGTASGEWLEYTINVSQPGFYNLALRVAGTSAGSIQVLTGGINGTNLTGTWTVPATGGAQTWTTISNVVFLTPGQQVLHLDVLGGGFNLNWLQFSPVTSGNFADGSYKLLNAASALAATGVSSSNKVFASSYTGSTSQQWNIQHIGGGQYKITAGDTGWNLTSGGYYFWINKRYFIQPAGNGYNRLVPSDSGFCFETSTTNQSVIDEKVSAGGVNQQWAIVSPTAPAFPTGLSAAAISATQIRLTWNAVTGATSYNVKRSLTSGGAYTTIATGVTAANYTDTVAAGTAYYYVVSAIIGGGESVNSVEATVSLPYPWQTQDVGSVGIVGSANYTYSNGVFTLTGSGSDIWGTADAFRFAYVPVTGNCTIIGRVRSVQNVDVWSKSGVMIRESLAANAANAFIAVTPGNGVTWQTRSSTGANSGNSAVGGIVAPYWIKLVRSGNTFTGYRSPDGINWTQQGTATFTMSTITYVGLALTSHNNSSLCAATFDNVTVPAWTVQNQGPTGLSATAISASQINLVWNAFTNATSYNLKRSTTNGGPYAIIASGVTATNYSDTGLAGGTMYYYVVSAIVSGSATADSVQAVATTVSPTEGSLVHRYSFSETGGTSIADSIGGPIWNGSLPNSGTLASGQLTLAAASSQYGNLPAGIVGSLSNFTIIAWVKLNSATNWSRIFDFGSGATTNMFLTPQNGGDGRLRFSITTNGGGSEQQINCSYTMTTGVWYQVAVTLNGNTGILYLNGVPVGTNNAMTLRPATLGSTANNYLGRSQYPDPYLDGAIDEFRIYNAGLSPAEIAATAALGSGQSLSTNSPAITPVATSSNLTLSWPLACAGYTVQWRTNLVLGSWVNAAPPAPQIVGTNWQVTLPMSGSNDSIFYRLLK
jgi:endoglucanase